MEEIGNMVLPTRSARSPAGAKGSLAKRVESVKGKVVDWSEDEDEDDADPRIALPATSRPGHISPLKSTKARKVGGKPKRVRWTDAEVQYLRDGVRAHGKGSWKQILENPEYQFLGRSQVDLKDKWRNLPEDPLSLSV